MIDDLALTTNGVFLAEQAGAIHRAGLHRVTVSLDTLRPQRFLHITRRDEHTRVLHGIATVPLAGFSGTKIDAVIMRGVNDDKLDDLIEFGRANDAEVRFIEYMDVPGATHWNMQNIVSRAEMLANLERRYGRITAVANDGSAPASRFLLSDGTVFGTIASTTAPFCARCDRSPSGVGICAVESRCATGSRTGFDAFGFLRGRRFVIYSGVTTIRWQIASVLDVGEDHIVGTEPDGFDESQA